MQLQVLVAGIAALMVGVGHASADVTQSAEPMEFSFVDSPPDGEGDWGEDDIMVLEKTSAYVSEGHVRFPKPCAKIEKIGFSFQYHLDRTPEMESTAIPIKIYHYGRSDIPLINDFGAGELIYTFTPVLNLPDRQTLIFFGPASTENTFDIAPGDDIALRFALDSENENLKVTISNVQFNHILCAEDDVPGEDPPVNDEEQALRDQLAELEAEKQVLEAANDQLLAEIAQHKSTIAAQDDEIADWVAKHVAKSIALNQAEKSLEELQRTNNANEAWIDMLVEHANLLNSQLQDRIRTEAALNNRIRVVKFFLGAIRRHVPTYLHRFIDHYRSW